MDMNMLKEDIRVTVGIFLADKLNVQNGKVMDELTEQIMEDITEALDKRRI